MREITWALVDARVLFVIDELSNRLRTAEGYEQLLERLEPELAELEADGWLLAGEVRDAA